MDRSVDILRNKVALVTGASGLLGQEHSLALASAGASVIMTDIDKQELSIAKCRVLKEFPGSRVKSFYMDVTSQKSINEVDDALASQNIVVTTLINNAAINPKNDHSSVDKGLCEGSRLENFDPSRFHQEVEVGLTGAILCASVFGKRMAKSGGGTIINIASDLSSISPYQKLYERPDVEHDLQPVKPVSYSVIKSGLHGLTLYLATYWARENVRSNTLSPGGIYNSHDPEFVSRLQGLIPLGRMANKNEYHGILIFLAGDGASYLNGQNILMDGGRSAW